MGIDPAPQMASLYLYYYEAKFMETLTKENYSAAKKFNYTRRYIDGRHIPWIMMDTQKKTTI